MISNKPALIVLLTCFLTGPLLFAPMSLFAATIDVPVITIASSPSPVGSGARAMGLGSAFLAIADDATAASWNPGGLVQLERPEISAVGTYSRRVENFSDSPHAQGDLSNSTDTASLNYLAVAYPFGLLNRNMVISLNYQEVLDFNRNLNFGLSQNRVPILTLKQDLVFRQRGSLNALSPAFCVQVVPSLSVGVAVNIWMDDVFSDRAWESHTRMEGQGSVTDLSTGASKPFSMSYRRDERFSGFLGVNATVGVLWKAWKGLQVGGLVKTPFRAHADRQYGWSLVSEDGTNPGNPPPGFPAPIQVGPTREEVDINYPWVFGLGLSYRFSDHWTVSADATRAEWGGFTIVQTDPETGARVETSPFTGVSTSQESVDATTTVRAGVEYLFILDKFVVPCRGGFFYDPLPSGDGHDDYFGFSVGSGLSWQRLSFDLAYTFRFGNNGMGNLLSGVTGSTADVAVHQFLFSAILYF